MHLRRAMLLFAIVLGLAALATSVSRPRDTRAPVSPPETATPSAPTSQAGRAAVRLAFDTSRPRRRLHLDAGRAAVVLVRAESAGLVELTELGLSATADALTPARFDVLAADPVRVAVRFTPAGADDSNVVGRLSVTSPGPARSGERPATRTAPDR